MHPLDLHALTLTLHRIGLDTATTPERCQPIDYAALVWVYQVEER